MAMVQPAHAPSLELRSVLEDFGTMLGDSGLISRAEGRIFALLMLSEDPLSQADIRKALTISEGSVSEGLRTLEGLGMVERLDVPKVRRSFFRVHPDAWVNCAEATLKFVLDMHAMAGRLSDLVDDETPVARDQIQAMSTYYALLARELPKVLRPGTKKVPKTRAS